MPHYYVTLEGNASKTVAPQLTTFPSKNRSKPTVSLPARYELTAREQKLLLYVIAMIEPEDEDFRPAVSACISLTLSYYGRPQ
jgi:hypothetical protein